MSQGSRPESVAEEIRKELSELITREVHDPGIGLMTITRVKMTPDLQLARVFYTIIGDEKGRKDAARALGRAAAFLRRNIGRRLRLRTVPELQFMYDESIEQQDRIERIIQDIQAERAEHPHLKDLIAGDDDSNSNDPRH